MGGEGGTGVREPGINGGAGSLLEAGLKRGRETEYPRGWEPREMGDKFRKTSEQFFAIEKAQRRREQVRKGAGAGSTRYGKREIQTSLRPPPPPFSHTIYVDRIEALNSPHSAFPNTARPIFLWRLLCKLFSDFFHMIIYLACE